MLLKFVSNSVITEVMRELIIQANKQLHFREKSIQNVTPFCPVNGNKNGSFSNI